MPRLYYAHFCDSEQDSGQGSGQQQNVNASLPLPLLLLLSLPRLPFGSDFWCDIKGQEPCPALDLGGN